MVQPLRIFEGIFQPKSHFNKIYQSEVTTGFGWRLTLLIFASAILNAIYVYIGIGTEELMSKMDQVVVGKLEWAKIIYGIGAFIGGLFYPIFLLFFFSILLWLFFREMNFRSLLYLQLYIIPIFLLEKLFNLPYYFLFGIDKTFSPFGFGPLLQQVAHHEFLIHFISSITFFNLWAIFIQCMALKIGTSQGVSKIIVLVVSIHVLLSLLLAIISTNLGRLPITF